jgi:hypothetical protein
MARSFQFRTVKIHVAVVLYSSLVGVDIETLRDLPKLDVVAVAHLQPKRAHADTIFCTI